MELIPVRFMLQMDNESLNPKQINILDKLDHGNDGMMQSSYCFKAACIRHNIQKLDDHIINALENVLDFKHIPLQQQPVNLMIGKLKRSLVHFTDNTCHLNDMLTSFNLKSPVVGKTSS